MIIKRLLSATVLSIGLLAGTTGVAGADNPDAAPQTPQQVHQVKAERNADITAAKVTYKATVAANAVKAPTMPSPKAWERTANYQALQRKKIAISAAQSKYEATLSGSLHNTYSFTR